MHKNLRQTKTFDYLASFVTPVAIIWMLYALGSYAPFGPNSLAVYDGGIQYVEFFAYLKDVMAGENSISYTFSQTLAGIQLFCLGIMGSYLAKTYIETKNRPHYIVADTNKEDAAILK